MLSQTSQLSDVWLCILFWMLILFSEEKHSLYNAIYADASQAVAIYIILNP